MKKIISLSFILFLFSVVNAQQKSFGTKKISQWNLEKFPLHYYVTPASSSIIKNKLTGKVEGYQEYNKFGQETGLTVIMRPDGVHIEGVKYVSKGHFVYIASYFNNSNIISGLRSTNLDDNLDGYQIMRTLKSSGGYEIEEIEKYDNGILIELNGVKQEATKVNYIDNLLNGKFKLDQNIKGFVIEGVAENGKLKSIKQAYDGKYSKAEIKFFNDSLQLWKTSDNTGKTYFVDSYPLNTEIIITNSIEKCTEYGNINGNPYYIFPDNLNIEYLVEYLSNYHPEPLKTETNFNDSLLDGNFKFREYIYSVDFLKSEYINYIGIATSGKLEKLTLEFIELNNKNNKIISKKTTEYIFSLTDVNILEYNENMQQVKSESIKILNPLLLTNSILLGGYIYFYDWRTIDNTLSFPYERRKGVVRDNSKGYYIFNPMTFDIVSYIKSLAIVSK